MRVLVTGASGFVGNALARRLTDLGHTLYVTGDCRENALDDSWHYLGYRFDDIDWPAISPIDVLFHQAAITDTLNNDAATVLQVNYRDALQLFFKASSHGCRRIVYASSCAVYGNQPAPFTEDLPLAPLNVYGKSKAWLDDFTFPFVAAVAGMRVVGLRYSNVYGPGEQCKGRMASMVYQLAQQIKSGRPPCIFTPGEQSRDFVYIRDVVAANLQAGLGDVPSGVYNCGSGIETSFNDLVDLLKKILGRKDLPTEYVVNQTPAAYQNRTLCNMGKAWHAAGIQPQWSLRDGLEDYFRNCHA
jgi:ADP-L-glycero-D-manno-heptose 6-epimerase